MPSWSFCVHRQLGLIVNDGFSLLQAWSSAKAANLIFLYIQVGLCCELGMLVCQLQLTASELTHLPSTGVIKMIQQFSSPDQVFQVIPVK